jgi:hypothetical protein
MAKNFLLDISDVNSIKILLPNEKDFGLLASPTSQARPHNPAPSTKIYPVSIRIPSLHAVVCLSAWPKQLP